MAAPYPTPCPRCGNPYPPTGNYCTACGLPRSALPPPVYWMPVTPPKKDNSALAIVVVVVVVVLIVPVVLGAILYVMVSGLIGGGPGPGPDTFSPTLTLDFTGCTGTSCSGRVVAVSQSFPITAYEVGVRQDGDLLFGPRPLEAGTFNESGLAFTFTDLEGEGQLTAGDTWTLDNVAAGTTYRVTFFWGADHQELNSVTFTA